MTIMIAVLFVLIAAVALCIAMTVREGRRHGALFGLANVAGNLFVAPARAPLPILATIFLLVALPGAVVKALWGIDGDEWMTAGGAAPGIAVAYVVIAFVFGTLAELIVLRAMVGGLRGDEVDFAAAMRGGVSGLLTAVLVRVAASIAIGFGMVLLLVPGIILMCLWSCAMPVVAVERGTFTDAFSRSTHLTAGARWRIMLLFLVAGVIWLAAAVLERLFRIALYGGGMSVGQAGMIVIGAASAIVLTVLRLGLVAAIYHELRSNKEGGGVSELETVFA